MAIITISFQYGSWGEKIAQDVAAHLGFPLITPEKLTEVIRDRYHLDYSPEWDVRQMPRMKESSRFYARLISAVLTDIALFDSIVVLECGGQFVFRSFPNALHVRITAPRETRVRNVIRERAISEENASKIIQDHDRQHDRFLRTTFRKSSETPERYDVIINTAALDIEPAGELILHAARLKNIEGYGMVSDESVERLRLRNQIRLQKALTNSSLEDNASLRQFAHPSERLFARLMDFYGIRWEYEPRTFPLRCDDEGNILEAFSPDFYLPDSDVYVELTTMKQSLVTKKNRKVRMLRELYPDMKIRLLYQKDFEDLLFKYTAGEKKKL